MTRADIDAIVSDSARSLRLEERLAWVLPMCVCALGLAGAAVMVLL